MSLDAEYPEAMAPITLDNLVREYICPHTWCMVAVFEVDGQVEEFIHRCSPDKDWFFQWAEYCAAVKQWVDRQQLQVAVDKAMRNCPSQDDYWPLRGDRLNWWGICKKVLRRIFV
jgi:hypothetical protein